MPKRKPVALVLSCEHAGHRIPAPYRKLFRGKQRELRSHRGWDPGAIELARAMARETGAPLLANTVSRLVVETNRSVGPKLFSEFTRTLTRDEKKKLVECMWACTLSRRCSTVRSEPPMWDYYSTRAARKRRISATCGCTRCTGKHRTCA